MAKLKTLLLPVEVRPAGRACDCKHNAKHRIIKGEARLAVSNPGPAGGERGYCASCATEMIEAARRRLDALEKQVHDLD